MEENQLLVSNLSTEYDKAWTLYGLLLRIGRPVSPIELASHCRFIPASPQLVEFLCSIPDSPISLIDDSFVSPSSSAVFSLIRFLLNLNRSSEFVPPRLRSEAVGLKRNWEPVEKTYVRKRRRLVLDKLDQPVLALLDRFQNAICKAQLPVDNQMVITTCSLVNFQTGLSNALHSDEHRSERRMNTSVSVSGKELACIHHEKATHVHNDTTLDGFEACMHYGEPCQLTICPGVQKDGIVYDHCLNSISACSQEVDKHKILSLTMTRDFTCSSKTGHKSHEDDRFMGYGNIRYSGNHKWDAKLDFKGGFGLGWNDMPSFADSERTLSFQEVSEQKRISPAEPKNQGVCEAQHVSLSEDGSVMCESEQSIGSGGKEVAEKISVNNASMDMPYEHHLKSKSIRGNDTRSYLGRDKTTDGLVNCVKFTEDPNSLEQKQRKESPSKLKIDPKDATNPSLQTLVNTSEKRKDFVHVGQQQCKNSRKAIATKQKLKQNCDRKIYTMEKRESSKENREKPTSISAKKNNLEPRLMPSFDSYIIEDEEGSGGYGTVYKARRKKDGTIFAIKCPHVNANRHHVQNELKMLERFGGKNFVIKYDGTFKSENSDCLVLEHVEHDRPEVLKREIDIFQLQWYGFCLFRALASLHKQGVAHRDVKPGNFLFSRRLNKGYLIDFNLAMDLHQKHGSTAKSKVNYDMTSLYVPLPQSESLPPTKSRKHVSSRTSEAVNQQADKLKLRWAPKNLKRKIDQIKEHIDLGSKMKSQGADGSGVTSAKDASSRIPSAEKLREPLPSQGRKELINLVHEAMQGPNHEVISILASKRKRVAAPSGTFDKKVVYVSPMPLHSAGVAVSGSGLLTNKGEGRQRKGGPCVGTRGFRAPEVLFRSTHQGVKVDIWSAGVSLFYLITGRTPFVGDPDQNIKEIAKLRGSEDLWEVAKLHNRESSFPSELLNIQALAPKRLRDWCKLNTRRPELLEVMPRSLLDLVDKCLTVNPRLRISAEDALRHEFFTPCIESLKKQRSLRQGLSMDSDTHPCD